MAIDVRCIQCNSPIQVDESQKGSMISCPECGQEQLVIATPQTVATEVPARAPTEPPSLEPTAVEPLASSLDIDGALAEQPGISEFLVPRATEDRFSAAPAAPSPVSSLTQSTVAPATKPPIPWGMMSAVYISGVMVGLILGRFMFGGKSAAAGPADLDAIRDDGVNKSKTQWVSPHSAVPPSQLRKVGETAQAGQLSVTAKGIERRKITKIHSFSDAKQESDDECLVLRIVLKNTSTDVEFSPLDPIFLRPHDPRERPTYSFIECPEGKDIPMYELGKFSEFDIEGQPFNTLKPGEEMGAIIPACEGSPARAKGRMVWHLQLRAGGRNGQSYSTVVGFEFTPDQIRG